MKFNLKKSILSFSLLSSLFLSSVTPNLALAAGWGQKQIGIDVVGKESYGSTEATDVRLVIANIIKVVLSFLGIFFVILVIKSGFEWMTAEGDSKKIGTAIDRIKNATIGLLLVLSAYGITEFITSSILSVTKQ